ncbi:MAG: nucleotidyltransferase domain-containing protein [Cyanobacteria bacterium P01_F01_bin.4]
MKNLPQLKAIVERQPYPLLFATISGAHLYGFDSPDSDYDLRGAHILPLKEIVGLKAGPETREVSSQEDSLELDLVTHDVKKFLGLLLKRNGYVLEQLYSPLVVHTTPEHVKLKELAQGCITRYHSHHYLGFAKTQWRLFSKAETLRVKPLLYVFRVLLTGLHLMQTGEIEANLVTLNETFQLPYLPDLIEQKVTGTEKGILVNVDLAFYEKEYERLVQRLEAAAIDTALPDGTTADADLNDLLIRIRCA